MLRILTALIAIHSFDMTRPGKTLALSGRRYRPADRAAEKPLLDFAGVFTG